MWQTEQGGKARPAAVTLSRVRHSYLQIDVVAGFSIEQQTFSAISVFFGRASEP
jgi:hypothetical protein